MKDPHNAAHASQNGPRLVCALPVAMVHPKVFLAVRRAVESNTSMKFGQAALMYLFSGHASCVADWYLVNVEAVSSNGKVWRLAPQGITDLQTVGLAPVKLHYLYRTLDPAHETRRVPSPQRRSDIGFVCTL